MSRDVTHAAYSKTYQLIANLVQQALGRVGGTREADTATFSGPVTQASGLHRPQPVPSSLRSGGWEGC